MGSVRRRLLTEEDIVERAELRRRRWLRLRLIAALILALLVSLFLFNQLATIRVPAGS